MAIKYDKLLKKLDEQGITSYTLTKKNKIIGMSAWVKLYEGGQIGTKTIDALCGFLHCQPGDLMEWVPDEDDKPRKGATASGEQDKEGQK